MNRDISQPEKSVNISLKCQSKPPQSILVVDDEFSLRRLLTDSLVQFGYHVNAVADGAAAWDALQDNTYDLVITDNSMPKLTGVEMIKLLRDKDVTLPVIMASGAFPTEEVARYPWLGINAFLLKPYTIDEMLKTVKNTLGQATSPIPGNPTIYKL
jgi:DNA-binding response OmpR family regulator